MKKLNPYFNTALYHSKLQNNNEYYNSNIIWVFWWQGKDNMPLLVKRCIQSVIKHSNKHKVVIITRYNIKKYANIPNYIYNKVYYKKISLTHLSDILRFNLLNNYGGLWVDSTIYCTSDIKNQCFHNIFTSGGYSNLFDQFVSSKWTGFLIGGYNNILLFRFMNEFFNLYWKENNKLIDYFMIDYALNYAYKNNISGFKDYVDNIAWRNNPHLYSLVDLLDEHYNSKIFNDINIDTTFFKLTYKRKFNGISNNTFYSKLLG